MTKIIAERKLLYSQKSSDARHELVIRIGAPYNVTQDMVKFPIGEGLVGCHVETSGLGNEYTHEVYGVDGIQALELASNIEPYLESLSKKYNLYWPTGEDYFEE